MEPTDITFSVVLYNNRREVVQRAIDSALSTDLKVKLYIIDNSSCDTLRDLCRNERTEYLLNDSNVGFGAAHNIAMRASLNFSKYHVVLNPDVYFSRGTIEAIYEYMDSNADVGLVMPKIVYPDGSPQYLCKLLPTPLDLVVRRFMPFHGLVDNRNRIFEMRFTGYNRIMDVPYLSGCFMFLRTAALKQVGFFDDRIFLYLEDLDLTRRIGRRYRTVYFPDVSVYHEYEKGSYRNLKLLMHHIRAAIYYFNKWGWLVDEEREKINGRILAGY